MKLKDPKTGKLKTYSFKRTDDKDNSAVVWLKSMNL